MRYILLVLLAFVTTFASAQVQFLGSPTTTVRNRGNFVSDSLFYLPKRTKAPSDTGAIRYQISDSALYVWTGSAWRSTGTAGSAITGSGVAGYMPEFTTATNIDTTRLYHSAGRFGIGTTSPSSFFDVIGTKSYAVGEQEGIRIIGTIAGRQGISFGYDSTSADQYANIQSHTGSERTTINYLGEKHKFTYGQVETAALYIDSLGNVGVRNTSPSYILDVSGTMRSTGNTYLGTSSAETYINTTTDAGAYALQVAGAIYNTTGAVLAASSGNVGIGTTSTDGKLHVVGPSSGNSPALIIQGTTSLPLEFYDTQPALNSKRWQFNTNSGIFFFRALSDDRTSFTNSYGIFRAGNITFGALTDAGYQVDVQGSLRSTGNTFLGTSSSEVYVNTTTDAGAYALQVAGSIYNTTGAVFAATSGTVAIKTTSTDGGVQLQLANGGDRANLARFYSNVDVGGATAGGSAASPALFFNGDSNTGLYWLSGDFIGVTTNGVNRMTWDNAGNVGIGTTTPSQPLHVVGNILTAAPSGGTAKPFKIGEAATVSPTSPNRTIRVEIDGTVYYIHAKTTND